MFNTLKPISNNISKHIKMITHAEQFASASNYPHLQASYNIGILAKNQITLLTQKDLG